MAAHLVVPLQKPKQEHQEHGGWLGAPAEGILAPALGWSMAWRSHGAVQQQPHRLVTARGIAATTATNEDAWEVRAFAEDAASCSEQWPPRSYSCSFCAREFRTAQALGGHMNVHRRERAYANQLGLMRSSSSNSSTTDAATASPTSAPTPALGVCWLYPLSVTTPSASSNSNLLLSPQQVSSTVTTATATTTAAAASVSMPISRMSDANRGFQAAPAVCIDRKKMLQDHDPNVDLELRLGQAAE